MDKERIFEIMDSDLNVFRALQTMLFTSADRNNQAKHFLELMLQFVKTKGTVKKFKRLGLIIEEEFLDGERKIQKEVSNFFEEYKKTNMSLPHLSWRMFVREF